MTNKPMDCRMPAEVKTKVEGLLQQAAECERGYVSGMNLVIDPGFFTQPKAVPDTSIEHIRDEESGGDHG